MRVVPIPHGLELAKSAPGIVRSPGLHMSAIYNDLFAGLDPKRYKQGDGPDPLRLEMGLAFEEMLEEALRVRLTAESGRPGELVSNEGIIYSPDLVIFNGSTRLGEIKLTWMSSKEVPRCPGEQFPPQFDKWLCQMKAYCHCMQLRDARLYAFFVNGNWKPPQPELLAWDIEFSRRELDDNWAMLINHAKHRRLL